jgi:outer membrane protein OmpA-like peptidoglycan-associated protein/tetratricopeptide (TPR) repeat protein
MNLSSLYTRFSIFILSVLLTVNIAHAQWYDPEKVSKKATGFYQTAFEEFKEGKFTESLADLDAALKADPKFLDVYAARADMYARMKKYPESVNDYIALFEKDTVFAKDFLLPYSVSLAGAGNFEKALQMTDKYLANANLNPQNRKAGTVRKSSYEFALQYEKNHPTKNYVFNPVNMGDGINTTDLEYLPSLTVDGNKMIFNRRINNDEDFYESDKVNGVWQTAKPVAGKLNTNFNEGAQNISQDGEWLIFTGCNYPEGMGSCDLYISYKNKNGEWSEAENMGRTINSESWESAPSLSPDKRDLYFSSNRPGGFGGSDIWVSHRAADGKWERPENLGATINTSGDDGTPFIHADNQTLYFNSNGHAGYGMSDIYVVRKNESGKWQEPENLGYPINTIDEEGSLVVSADGKTAFYASDKGNYKNKLDLYTFDLRDDIRALKTLWVKGKIYDKKTNAGLPSTVELATIDSGYVLSKLQADEDGNYLTTLPAGKNYSFTVNRKGYLFYSENFEMAGTVSDSPMVVNIALQPIEKGASIVLKNIFFESKKFDLQTISNPELDKVVAILKENPGVTILISGYTDNVGKPADNLLLSVNRAKSVVTYLQSKGIDPKRLSGKGFGEANPIAPNTTEEGRALNRRTELTILSN